MTKVRIGIDVMGGDFAPSATIEGSVLALDNLDDIEIVLIGDQDQITSELKKHQVDASAFSIVHAPDIMKWAITPPKHLFKTQL